MSATRASVVSIREAIAPAFYNALQRGFEMAQMTPEVARLLEQALTLSVEEQEALADSLILQPRR